MSVSLLPSLRRLLVFLHTPALQSVWECVVLLFMFGSLEKPANIILLLLLYSSVNHHHRSLYFPSHVVIVVVVVFRMSVLRVKADLTPVRATALAASNWLLNGHTAAAASTSRPLEGEF